MTFVRILCLLGISISTAQAQDSVPSLEKKVDLLSDPSAFESVLARKNSVTQDAAEAFDFNKENKTLRVTGKGWGYTRTAAEYANYHLVAEFKWGEHTFGGRADKSRDCGIFVHINGRDGAIGGSWPVGAEVQLIESMSGNVALLGTARAPWDVVADGKKLTGERLKIYGKAWDETWQDVKGWHTKANKIEPNFGQWNRIEIICEDEVLTVILNGEVVNRIEGVSPAAGKIGIQSELAECWFRRLELHPLGAFKEEWMAAWASENMGYASNGDAILPRDFPLSPEESMASWVIDGDYELQLVASEPLVCDPVDVVWDEHGRMFVAEMRDYPLPVDAGGFLSRIRLLKDTDGDGKMDEATTWADGLDNLQGLLPMKGGLLATTRTALLFLEDKDGDDVAENVTALFKSNEPRHNQLQVSCARWGIDNLIYLNNGLDLKEIYPVDEPEKKVSISRSNISFDPKSNVIEAVSGYGQFGATIDDWGRRFSCSNRNPTMFAVMPKWAVQRNPFDHITQGHIDIAPAGADSKVYPFEISHTTSVAHAGTHTAACGLGVYRGNLMPDLNGNVFVTEPTAQLITRSTLKSDGGSLKTERVGEKQDFLVSSDAWARPVNMRNSPDGALYFCDMYRRFIDHARFFPEEFSKSHYMRAGVDQGRIYRLVPKGHVAKKIEPLPEADADLASLLSSPNGWTRTHAQRLLVERQAEGIEQVVRQVFENSELPQGRLHSFWTLHGLGKLTSDDVGRALNDPHPAVVENAVTQATPENHNDFILKIAEEGSDRAQYAALLELGYAPTPEVTKLFQEVLHNRGGIRDQWIRNAILTGSEERAGAILAYSLDNPIAAGNGIAPTLEQRADFIRDFATAVGARGDSAELAAILKPIGKIEANEFKFALAEGITNGLKKSKLKTKTLAAFIATPPEGCADSIPALQAIVTSAEAIVADDSKSVAERIAAIPLASQQTFEKYKTIAEKLVDPATPPELARASVAAMSRFKRQDLADFFYERWENLNLETRRGAVSLLASGATLIPLMEKMKAGEINPRLMEPIKSWSYARSTNEEIKTLAHELFGQTDSDRAKVIADYKTIFDTERVADLENGKAVLTRAACITCHKIGDMGVAVGPDLADVKVKPAIALLTDILDPNRASEERWVSHTVTTDDGGIFTGIITGDDNTNLSVKLPGGAVQTVPRETVAKIDSAGISLMPAGLEGGISKEDMFDLISFLKAR